MPSQTQGDPNQIVGVGYRGGWLGLIFHKGWGSGVNQLQAVRSFADWDKLRLLQNPILIPLMVLP